MPDGEHHTPPAGDSSAATPSGDSTQDDLVPLAPSEAARALRGEMEGNTEVTLLGPPSLVGVILGQYRLMEKIGQGGMGAVFKGHDSALNRTVAMKVLHCGPLDDQKTAERFQREAQSLARLSHPNLLHVYNVGSQGEMHYFAMELLEGGTLSQVINARSRLPVDEALHVAGQILSALHYVHHQGITHRDIKSGNIMICGHRAVLMDFGLAKDENFSGLTSVGVVLGTPEYMSPEQAEGDSAGAPTDIYSLGVVLYEMLCGTVPFLGRSAMSVIRQHLADEPPSLASRVPGIDPRLVEIVRRCLLKKPEERYPSCAALAADLLNVGYTNELAQLAGGDEARPTIMRPQSPLGGGAPLAPTIAADTRGSAHGQAGTQDTVLGGAPLDPSTRLPTESTDSTKKTGYRFRWWHVPVALVVLMILLNVLANLGKDRRRARPDDGRFRYQRVELSDPQDPEKKMVVRWISFIRNGNDPSKWLHEIEVKQADETWERKQLTHERFMELAGEQDLNFLHAAESSQP